MRIDRVLNYLAMAAASLLFVTPVLYMLIGSVTPSDKVLDGVAVFAPHTLTSKNFTGLFARFDSADTGYFLGFVLVSLVTTGTVVLLGLVVNSLAGYALARLRWCGRRFTLAAVLALSVVPFEGLAAPLSYLLAGLRDTVVVQVLPFVASAFVTFMFYTAFREVPAEVEEAAELDGAGVWRTYATIVVPMSKPVFASAAILTFLTQWGTFLWPVVMVSDPTVRPLPLAISVFQGQPPYDWGQIMAFGVVMVAPVLAVFVTFQRWFVRSLANSAVKG